MGQSRCSAARHFQLDVLQRFCDGDGLDVGFCRSYCFGCLAARLLEGVRAGEQQTLNFQQEQDEIERLEGRA